ncbi:unnamed protein product [Meganyctiphanes norvegica]|uniref:Nose resistant-to-fluoxetine protein N-terminal domain-containing protein n=1 Tax=Meganyctiphanes norvegica TaxID=48144 RepID=A0AAV2Q5C5_MEGNR
MGARMFWLSVVFMITLAISQDVDADWQQRGGLSGLSPQRQQALKHRYNKIWTGQRSGGAGSMYLPSPEPGSACSEALDRVNPITKLTMVDAWGKMPDGYLFGNKYPWGQYDQCVRLEDDATDIKGKYCIVYYREHYTSEQEQAMPLEWVEMDIPSLVDIPGISMQYGTCMPYQCSEQELTDSVEAKLNDTNKYLYSLHCYNTQEKIKFDGVDISFIMFCVVVWVLMVGGAIAEEYIQRTKQENLKKGPLRFVIAFSVTTNMKKLFAINPNAKGAITVLYGMRFLSMCWVVHGHMQFFGTSLNYAIQPEKTDGLLFQIIRYANVVTDTFFFMGGMLVTYGLLRELERTGKFNIIMYYVHRLIRLSPLIAFVSWFYASVMYHFIEGPTAYNAERTRANCQKYWWKDAFHVTNIPTIHNMCNGQLWYTTVDTQIYIVGWVMIVPLYYFKKAGRAWLYLLTIVFLIIPGAIIYKHDLAPGHYSNPKDGEYSKYIYRMPWSRASAWIVGIWAGYILNQMSHKKLILKTWMVVAGWTVCFATLFLVQFGLYSYAQSIPKAQYDVMTQVFYGGLHRAAWSACLAWIVIACTAGYGGIIHEFLSHPGWQPLSKLTFPMYVIAFNLQSSITKTYRVPSYWGHLEKIIETCGMLFFVGIGAVFLTLMIEVPILNLEKLLLKRPGRGVQADNKNVKKDGQDNPLIVEEKEKSNDEVKDKDMANGVNSHTEISNIINEDTVTNDVSITGTEKKTIEDSVIMMNEISKAT